MYCHKLITISTCEIIDMDDIHMSAKQASAVYYAILVSMFPKHPEFLEVETIFVLH